MNPRDYFIDASPWVKLGLTAFFAVSSFLALLVISFLLAVPLFNISLMELESELNFETTSNINILKYFQIVQAISLFIIPALLSGYFLYGSDERFFGLGIKQKPSIRAIVLAAAAMIIALPLINLLAIINQHAQLPDFLSGMETWMQTQESYAQELTEYFLEVKNINGLLLNIFMIGILPGIGEEFLFRGVIQRIFGNITKNIHAAILITSILFSALHFQFYGFIPRLVMGIYFGYLLVWTGNIWVPVIAHFANNTFAVVIYYFYRPGTTKFDIEEIGASPETLYTSAISLVLTGLIIAVIYLKERKPNVNQVRML